MELLVRPAPAAAAGILRAVSAFLHPSRLVFFASAALLACSSAPNRVLVASDASSTDLGAMDAAIDATGDAQSHTCTSGRWYCDGPGRAFRCNDSGVETSSENCIDGARCVGGAISCGTCTPGAVRCDAEHPSSPSICSPDGRTWELHRACDTASGEFCVNGTCQRPCMASAGSENSYLGCEYWATPTANSGVNYSFSYAVVLANPGTTDANVTVTGGRLGSPITRVVAAGSVERIDLPWIDVLKGSTRACHPLPLGLDCSSRSAFGRVSTHEGSYRVFSDVAIAAYQFNPLEYRTGMGSSTTFSFTADASLLLPQGVLGDPRNQDYLVVTRPNWARDRLSPPFGAFVAIVGSGPSDGDPVEVQIDTRATVGDPRTRGRELPPGHYTFTLARGDVLQLVGTRLDEDLTGSAIHANGPIAVFAGHDCTFVPRDRGACDHLEEQLLPLATWGRRYAVTFLRDRTAEPNESSVVRIMSQADGNRLTFEGIATPPECNVLLNRGQFCEFSTSENFMVSGERPLLVTQFMIGLGTRPECSTVPGVPPPDRDDCVGDPAMVLEVPVEQFRNRYDVLIPSTYRLNFVNLIAPTGAEVTLDGMPLDPARVRGPFPVGAGFEVRVLQIDAGAHTLATADGRPFGTKVYGVAAYTSYMYPGGLDLRPINPPG